MGDFARIMLTGYDALKKRLQDMDTELRENALRAVTFAGANVICQQAIKNAPYYTGEVSEDVICQQAIENAPYYTGEVSEGHPPPGTLKKSIIVKRIEEQSGPYRETYYVTVRRGKVGSDSDAYYAHMVEYGHFARGPGQKLKGGARSKAAQRVALEASGAKFVPAQSYMRTAYEMKKDDAVRAMQEKLNERLNSVK
jgi:HK97 gp10 family phage protein